MDLELTCWKGQSDFKVQEIIEIGAVKLNMSLQKIEEFDSFIHPIINPQLSQFCQDLTHISQSEVDKSDPFSIVFNRFVLWIGREPYFIVTWGDSDINHLKHECKRHDVQIPRKFTKKQINLKAKFAEKMRIRPCGMDQALQMMRIPLEGTHHRGIDDARNIAKIFGKLF